MSEPNDKNGERSSNDSADEFEFYIQFTKPLVLDLRSSEDKAIASAWVQKLEVPPQTEEEKKLRLDYLKLLLFVLQRGRLSGIFKKQPPPGGLQPFPQGFSMADMGNLIIDRDEVQSSGGGDNQSVPYTIELSSDLREFVAAQEIPNFGVQMYYAWSANDAIHKWSLFDEDKFSTYILDKIKQLKDAKSDDKTSTKICKDKKPCDLSYTKNFKSKVKSPEEIEKAQGRSYQTYVGLVGRMGGGFKECDDDQDKCPRQEQRKSGSSKKCGAPRRCPAEMDEEYDNFLSGLSGHNSTQKRNCKCPPSSQHRPDCDARGKGVQPFEERNPRSISPISKPETGGCNVWPGPGAGGNKRQNVPRDQCEYGTEFSPVDFSPQRNLQSCRSVSPIPQIRNDAPATGTACKDSNRIATCSCPIPPCTCPCPRQPAPQSFQLDVPKAAAGPSPAIGPQGSSGRSCGDRPRARLQRPVSLMAPPESACRSGGVGEASVSPQPQLHCYNPQYQNACPKPQPTIKTNQDMWCADEELKSQDDRRKQKIANLSKIIAKEAREEDEIDDAFSCQYKASSASNRQNFECPQGFPSQGSGVPQPCSKMRTPPNQGKMRQQQPQADSPCFDFGLSAFSSSNSCYSGGYTQSMTNSMTQGPYSMSSECKRKPKVNTETFVKSTAGYCQQNQAQYDERPPCQHMPPSMEGSEGRSPCPSAQQADPCQNFKSPSMMRPKNQSDNCQSGGYPSSNTGRVHDLATVLQGIKLKAEAHREKCGQSGSRRPQSGEPSSCPRNPQSRSLSPFQNQNSYQPCAPQKSQSQSQTQSQCQSQSKSSGKSCPEAMAEGMTPGQYADASQNVPTSWGSPTTYCPPQNMRLAMNYDNSFRKEGTNSSGKGVWANPHSQSPGAFKSSRSSQGPPSQTCQGPSNYQGSPSNYQRPSTSNYMRPSPSPCQGPSPSTCQRPPPSTCQEPPPSACQGPPPSTRQGSSPSACQGPPPSACQGSPPSTCQGPMPSNYQGPPPSACQGSPPSTCQGPMPSNYQGPPPSACQGSPPSTCQEPMPSNYQGPSPSTCQGFQPPNSQGLQPSSCQGPPGSNFQELPSAACQQEDEDPCDEEDDVSGPESLDEGPPESCASADFLESAPCEDMQPAPQPCNPQPCGQPQQWPAPAPAPGPSCRRSPEPRPKDCGQNSQSRRRVMITSTPLQQPFLSDESTIPCVSPQPCNMDCQYEQIYGSYDCQSQGQNQEAQFYPIFGNSDNDCGIQSQQCFGGFMDIPNETQGADNTTTNRRRNMLAAPLPDDQQFSGSQTQNQFNSCNNSGY